ncbi:hypothetical protein GCM10009662_76120 [Catellatospora coxensis]|uniref:Uncharacterized protein n=2 Tax=Catellatospora coxensis TaxID=310354 RepID=A0A8J3PAY1_9ACTN|nr:hypothetical protein Cco03nite_67690 [Catellatospora coxensis]
MDMNKWFYRAVGAVGVAGGVMLLGSGVAHAETVSEAQPTADLQAMRGLVADLFSPTGGLHNLGLSIDMPDTRLNAGLVADGPLSITRGTGDLGVTAYAPGVQDISLTGKAPALTRALPSTDLLSSTGLLNGAGKEEVLPGLDSVTGMLSGGPLGGLLGAQPGGSPIGGLTNGPLGGLTSGLMGGPDGGGTLGGLLGGDGGPLGGLTGGLTGGDSPLGGITGSLTDLTGGLSGGLNGSARAADPLASLTGGLGGDALNGLTGERNDLSGIQPAPLPAPGSPAVDTTRDSFGEWLGDQPTGMPSGMLARQDVIDPLLDTDALDPSDAQGVTLDPALSQQVADATSQIVPALIADAMGQPSGDELLATEGMPTAEGLPFVDKLPILNGVLGNGGPLDSILVVGDIAKQVPGVRDLASGKLSLDTVTKLPIVGGMLTGGIVQGGKPGTALPVVGSLPVVGDALGKITGGLSGMSPGRGANLLNPAPTLDTQLPVGQQLSAPAPQPQHVGRHRATERPIAGEDAEYAESATAEAGLPGLPDLGGLPLLGSLTGGAGAGGLGVGSLLGQLPLVNDLPILGNMATSMEVLRALPLVGTAAGLLPLESDTLI